MGASKVVFNSLLILARSVVTRPGDPIISRADREIPSNVNLVGRAVPELPVDRLRGRKADGERRVSHGETESGQLLRAGRSHISEIASEIAIKGI